MISLGDWHKAVLLASHYAKAEWSHVGVASKIALSKEDFWEVVNQLEEECLVKCHIRKINGTERFPVDTTRKEYSLTVKGQKAVDQMMVVINGKYRPEGVLL